MSAEHEAFQAKPRLDTLRSDVLASFVVFLVALPLCMGIAMASGVPPAAGILSGVIGGLVVASLGGSPMQVSGPANGLIVVVWMVNQQYGLAVLSAAVLAAGSFQLLAGTFRLGQWFRAVSPAVIHGLMTGFAVIIFASQFHVMLDDAPRGSAVENLIAIPVAFYDGFFPIDGSAHHWAAAMGILTVLILLGWKLLPSCMRPLPASLVAVAAAATLATLLDLPVARVELPAQISGMVQLLEPAALWRLAEWPVLEIALTIAFLASTETLLSASAVDQLHQGPRTRYDRELTAQGLGNIVCGLLGALPLTGVIIRSAANVAAGARTRLSSVLHGCWLLVFVMLLPGLLALIPTASLAAVLAVAVLKLINLPLIYNWWKQDRLNLLIYAITATVIVFSGVLVGVAVGFGLSLARLLFTFSHLAIHQEFEEGRTIFRLEGAATFIRLPKLAAALEAAPPRGELHVQIDQMSFIDDACLELLTSWHKQHEAMGGRLVIDWESLSAKLNTGTNGTGNSAKSPEVATFR
ncbi:MAG: SulP family inorganic anion transporter [Gemmataceae bacterium]